MASTDRTGELGAFLSQKTGAPVDVLAYTEAKDLYPTLVVFLADRVAIVHEKFGELELAIECPYGDVRDLSSEAGYFGNQCRVQLGRELLTLSQLTDDGVATLKTYLSGDRHSPTPPNLTPAAAEPVSRGASLPADPQAEIGRLHVAIEENLDDAENFRRLFALYDTIGNKDAAWCIASTLSLLQLAGERERTFYRDNAVANVAFGSKPLSPRHWLQLIHSDQDVALGNILSMFAAFLRDIIAVPLKSKWGVGKKDILDLSSQTTFAKLFNHTARTLDVSPCNVYVSSELDSGIHNANSDPPSMVVAEPILSGTTMRESAFIVGRGLCLMRNDHYLGSALPDIETLKVYVYAALAVTSSLIEVPAMYSQHMGQLVPRIGKRPHALVALQKTVNHYLSTGRNPDVEKWLTSLDLTADRVGLLLCGDINSAVGLMATHAKPLSTVTVRDRLLELIRFSVSPGYLLLRRELDLGLAG